MTVKQIIQHSINVDIITLTAKIKPKAHSNDNEARNSVANLHLRNYLLNTGRVN